ncbi:MAG: tRNA (adenosine(37)-N6)-threonylcarbamoyltransferase complex ATPase subunit type 1 TsaE, partial [Alphaproteobacteria bacterium]
RLDSPAATAALARRLAQAARPGDVFALSGKLGAGKTHFARHFVAARAADPSIEVPSPTFTLVQVYELPGGAIWHFDLYRIATPGELDELGWDDACAGGIVLVEWPARAGARLPTERLDIEIDFAADAEARVAQLIGRGAWAARLTELDL